MKYVYFVATDAWSGDGSVVSDDEHKAACARMSAYLAENVPNGVEVEARPCPRGRGGDDGLRRLRGGEYVAVHDEQDIEAIASRAYQYALDTWPR